MRHGEQLEALFDEVRLLWHALVQAAERLHARELVTLGMRAVLEFLLLKGPSTVPQIARSRLVTRQHVQTLVNALLHGGLVALDANPAHKRSGLVTLTSVGERTIRRMKRREARLLASAGTRIAAGDVKRAAAALRAVRAALTGGKP